MNYTYYHQDRKPVGLRRYASGQALAEMLFPGSTT